MQNVQGAKNMSACLIFKLCTLWEENVNIHIRGDDFSFQIALKKKVSFGTML